jgi:hypothetical protein
MASDTAALCRVRGVGRLFSVLPGPEALNTAVEPAFVLPDPTSLARTRAGRTQVIFSASQQPDSQGATSPTGFRHKEPGECIFSLFEVEGSAGVGSNNRVPGSEYFAQTCRRALNANTALLQSGCRI